MANPFPWLHAMHPPVVITAFLLSLAGHLQETTGECCLAYERLLVRTLQGGMGSTRFAWPQHSFLPARNRACFLPPSVPICPLSRTWHHYSGTSSMGAQSWKVMGFSQWLSSIKFTVHHCHRKHSPYV